MGRAKDIEVRVIPSRIANDFVRKHHYSGKVVNNSTLHFGAFINGRLHGVMSFGNPMDKSKVLGLVEGTGWSNMLELNRMAFDDVLPRNSESRCIAIAMMLLKKNAPHVKWVLSFADGTQCGDGTIYRASGFILTDIRISKNLAMLPDGSVVHKMAVESSPTTPRKDLDGKSLMQINGGGSTSWKTWLQYTGAKIIDGYQLRYIYFIDKKWRDRLTVEQIPFEKIDEIGAGMYKGEKSSVESRK